MAEIAPFRGIVYTPKAGDPSKLLAPPYDVISDAERAQLAGADPHNCVRLILPVADKAEKDPDARYQQAARDLQAWLADGTLARDAQPAIYRYHQSFEVYGKPVTRKGFVSRIRLQPFSDRVVLPHERTLSGPKEDRLKLFRATHAHFSQIFGLYDDPRYEVDGMFEELEKGPPALEGSTSDGVTHRMWRLTDERLQKRLCEWMEAKKVYIADGHHRYETMLAYASELRKDAAGENASSEYGVMFFCNMDDPGLVVLPTHRVLHGVDQFNLDEVLANAREFFKVLSGPLAEPAVVRQALAGHAKRQPTFAMVVPGAPNIYYIQLRGDLIKESVPELGSRAEADLDVTLLHALMLEKLLKIDRAAVEKQTNLRYVKDFDKAFAELSQPGVQAVFLMNPTKVSQVKAVADEGTVMPQKSTFFYPKIASGLVMNPVDPKEQADLVVEPPVREAPAQVTAPPPAATEKPAAATEKPAAATEKAAAGDGDKGAPHAPDKPADKPAPDAKQA